MYVRVESIIHPFLPREQTRFCREKSTADQVTLLSQEIEDRFSAKKKPGAGFVNLTAAYDTA